ncbi:MAG: AAC(3) family N-acetyltransferase [Clostridia bacterium]|nr:AAC(3) family N-acetyltransferase [Clostridia bacterium]
MYTKNDIFAQLDAMHAPKGSVVMMHTSLRLVGEIEGGAQGLLDAMIEYFTADGGLFCVPTHTWSEIGEDKITLDFLNPESCLGTFSDIAAKDPRGVRSVNPTHSIVVFGDRAAAEEFVKDDEFVKTSTAPESCYGKIIERGGYILLVGVAHNRNTVLHCAAEMLKLPNRMADKPRPTTIRMQDGTVIDREITLYYTDYSPDICWRFPKYETAFRYHGCITDGFIGDAPTQLCSAAKMKDTIALIWERSGGEDPLAVEDPIPQAWYCRK